MMPLTFIIMLLWLRTIAYFILSVCYKLLHTATTRQCTSSFKIEFDLRHLQVCSFLCVFVTRKSDKCQGQTLPRKHKLLQKHIYVL